MKPMNNLLSIVLLGVIGAALTVSSAFIEAAETAEEKGLAIAQERKAIDIGWGDSISKSKMILRNAQGQKAVRKMLMKSLEVKGDGDKSLIVFDQPRDVKGTAFLSFSHSTGSDEQWIYLPALKRVKRIASRNKSGPFMGSEFAFEDLSSFEIDKYTYKFLREESANSKACDVVEADPVNEYSGYTRLLMWIDKSQHLTQKIEFYDRKNSLVKTLTFLQYQLYRGKYWRAMKMSMVNEQNGKSTVLITSELSFNTGLREKDFNKTTLKRTR